MFRFVRIEDYAATVGSMRVFAEGSDHQQPGDPARLAEVPLLLADAKTPPRRLPLGSGTVAFCQVGVEGFGNYDEFADVNWSLVAFGRADGGVRAFEARVQFALGKSDHDIVWLRLGCPEAFASMMASRGDFYANLQGMAFSG